jgi:cell shape-determining protein MreC
VSEVVKRDFGIYQTVIAEPTVDFSRLREVLIVLSQTGGAAVVGKEDDRTSQAGKPGPN